MGKANNIYDPKIKSVTFETIKEYCFKQDGQKIRTIKTI